MDLTLKKTSYGIINRARFNDGWYNQFFSFAKNVSINNENERFIQGISLDPILHWQLDGF